MVLLGPSGTGDHSAVRADVRAPAVLVEQRILWNGAAVSCDRGFGPLTGARADSNKGLGVGTDHLRLYGRGGARAPELCLRIETKTRGRDADVGAKFVWCEATANRGEKNQQQVE